MSCSAFLVHQENVLDLGGLEPSSCIKERFAVHDAWEWCNSQQCSIVIFLYFFSFLFHIIIYVFFAMSPFPHQTFPCMLFFCMNFSWQIPAHAHKLIQFDCLFLIKAVHWRVVNGCQGQLWNLEMPCVSRIEFCVLCLWTHFCLIALG